jgi:hypothetical protein
LKDEQSRKKDGYVLPFHKIGYAKTWMRDADGNVDCSIAVRVPGLQLSKETISAVAFFKSNVSGPARHAREQINANCCRIAENVRDISMTIGCDRYKEITNAGGRRAENHRREDYGSKQSEPGMIPARFIYARF